MAGGCGCGEGWELLRWRCVEGGMSHCSVGKRGEKEVQRNAGTSKNNCFSTSGFFPEFSVSNWSRYNLVVRFCPIFFFFFQFCCWLI